MDKKCCTHCQNAKPMHLYQIVCTVGWSIEEFVEACKDYVEPTKIFDWGKVLKDLWVKTHRPIHSYYDLKYKFRYYNDWQAIVEFILDMDILQSMYFAEVPTLTLGDLELVLKLQNKKVMPSDPDEKEVVWNLGTLIIVLYHYLKRDAEKTFQELEEMRKAVQTRIKHDEARQTAHRVKNFNRRQNKKKNKRK